MTELVHTEHHGGIAVLTLVNPPVNALSAALRVALYDALTAARDDAAVRGIVVTGGGRCFSGGADITEFQRSADAGLSSGRDLNELAALCDGIAKPVVAAIHGYALGGGLEIALGAHARVAVQGSVVGLPEIKLGVLPGAGGTQRLPRLVGVEAALAVILPGEPIPAAKAHAIGLVDRVVESDVVDAACAHAVQLADAAQPPRRARDRVLPALDMADVAALRAARTTLSRQRAHAGAADRIVDCVIAATTMPFDDGMAYERAQFLACNASPEAAALQHAFFAQREAAKIAGTPADTRERTVRVVAVIGGGTMGRGIALALLAGGLAVRLFEASAGQAAAAVQTIAAEIARLHAAGKLDAATAAARTSALVAADGDEALAACDLVIEAIVEDMAAKRALFARLGRVCRPGAVLASNTSTLDLDVLATSSGRPADVVGLHFFSPAQVMRLLEVVRGAETAPDVLVTAMALARKLNKVAVVAGVCHGFIGNRMLEPYLREAEALMLEGVRPSAIDRALEDFGMAMGPCRMMDLAGVDLVASVVAGREAEVGAPSPTYRRAARALAAAGRHGQKNGKGFYRYDGRTALDDDEAGMLIAALGANLGVQARSGVTDTEIVERCVLTMVNEGWRIVDEGIAARASDVDVVWLFGYGFPAELGGPLFYARRTGAGRVVDRLRHYAGERPGDPAAFWAPAEGLLTAAANPA